MLRRERAEWEAERRQLMEKHHALLEHHTMQTADLTAAVQLLQRQLQASTAAPSGVQPGAALLEFQAKHCLEHVEARNEDNWNLLHLAAVATLDTPGMLPIIKDLLRCLPAGHLAEETCTGKPQGFTPLHLLCQGADPLGVREEAIPLLIAAKAPLEPHNNPKGATPLLVAAGSAFLPAVRALVNGKADINAAQHGRKTAWNLAKDTGKTLWIDIERMGGRTGIVEQAPPRSRAEARAGWQPPNRQRRQARRNADAAYEARQNAESSRRSASQRRSNRPWRARRGHPDLR